MKHKKAFGMIKVAEKVQYKIWKFEEKVIIFIKSKEDYVGDIWMFHQICKEIDCDVSKESWISVKSFERIIQIATQNGTKFRPIRELGDTDKRSVFITFDDGFDGVYYNAYPIFKQYMIPFTIFVTVEFIDKPGYMTEKQIKELSEDELCTIGAHTMRHRMLRKLKRADAQWEIEQGRKQLQQLLGQSIKYFAYPYGNIEAVSKRDINIVKRAGYEYAFSTLQMPLTFGMIKETFFIPRWNINETNAIRRLGSGY